MQLEITKQETWALDDEEDMVEKLFAVDSFYFIQMVARLTASSWLKCCTNTGLSKTQKGIRGHLIQGHLSIVLVPT